MAKNRCISVLFALLLLPMENNTASNPKSLVLSKRAVLVGVIVVLLLFITSYILTFVIPRGS